MRSSGDPELDEESWKKTKAEFDCGSLVGPFLSLDEVRSLMGTRVRLLPRFPIWEQHGGSKEPTCRNIDNGLLGGQNHMIGMQVTNRPADLDLFIGLLRSLMEKFPDCPLLGCTSDFKSVYRQCTANPQHAPYWVFTTWDPVLSKQVYAVAAAQLFGGSSAPLNFCRIPGWCTFAASRLFFMAFVSCIDDMIFCERASHSAVAFCIALCYRIT